MGAILTQTGGTGAAGDLTNAIGNALLSVLCEGTGATVSTSAVAWVIANAEAETESILGPGFTVPLVAAAVTTVIKRCTTDIAVHFAYKRKPEFRTNQGKTPVQQDYDDARKALTDIRNGERSSSNQESALSGGYVYASTQSFITDPAEGGTGGPSGGF